MPVRLTNISTDGAAFVGAVLPMIGAYVQFRRNHIKVRARLAWATTPGHGGISFTNSLDPESVLRLVPAPRVHWRPECRRPPLKPGPLSWAERDSIERCSTLLGITKAG